MSHRPLVRYEDCDVDSQARRSSNCKPTASPPPAPTIVTPGASELVLINKRTQGGDREDIIQRLQFAFSPAGPDRPHLAAFGCAALAAGIPGAHAADVTYERLLNPEPQNWLMNHHDYNSQRFSPLDKINKSNVKNLKLAFAVPLGGTSPQRIRRGDAAGRRRLHVHHRRLGRGLQDRRALRHAGPHPVEDGSRPAEARPQPRRRAVGQSRHLGHRPRRPRHRDRQGDRQGRLGQEPARPGRPRDHRGAARAQGRDH